MNTPDELLAAVFVERHPEEAAAILETDAEHAAPLLGTAPTEHAVAVLRRMTPVGAAACISAMVPSAAGAVVTQMQADDVAALLRRMPSDRVDQLLGMVPASHAAALRAGLAFPARSVGSLMDPRIPVLNPELTAAHAIAQLRDLGRDLDDEVYVVDREQRLAGRLPMRVLVVAAAEASVSALMQPAVARLPPQRGVDVAYAHPGWSRARTMPVVTDDGRLLGVVAFDVIARLVHEVGVTRLAEASVGTLASFGELCYVGSTHTVAALVSLVTEQIDQFAAEASG